MTVKEMLCRIDSLELTEWMIYCTLEPFGDEQRPVAQLTALHANMNRKKNAKPYKADDFMPTVRRAASKINSSQVVMQFKAFAARQNAIAKKRHGNNNRIS